MHQSGKVLLRLLDSQKKRKKQVNVNIDSCYTQKQVLGSFGRERGWKSPGRIRKEECLRPQSWLPGINAPRQRGNIGSVSGLGNLGKENSFTEITKST